MPVCVCGVLVEHALPWRNNCAVRLDPNSLPSTMCCATSANSYHKHYTLYSRPGSNACSEMQMGIWSLVTELKWFLSEHKRDIMMIQEAHCSEKCVYSWNMQNYSIIHQECQWDRRAGGNVCGGGVTTLIKLGISFHCNANSFTTPQNETTEVLTVQIFDQGRQRLQFINMYIHLFVRVVSTPESSALTPQHSWVTGTHLCVAT